MPPTWPVSSSDVCNGMQCIALQSRLRCCERARRRVGETLALAPRLRNATVGGAAWREGGLQLARVRHGLQWAAAGGGVRQTRRLASNFGQAVGVGPDSALSKDSKPKNGSEMGRFLFGLTQKKHFIIKQRTYVQLAHSCDSSRVNTTAASLCTPPPFSCPKLLCVPSLPHQPTPLRWLSCMKAIEILLECSRGLQF